MGSKDTPQTGVSNIPSTSLAGAGEDASTNATGRTTGAVSGSNSASTTEVNANATAAAPAKTVRAKFRVTAITPNATGEAHIGLAPVTDNSDENAAFYKATPSGSITLPMVGAETAKSFILNAEYFVDFIPAQ